MIRRVLMTADAVGGVWTYALELCRALGARGVEVLLAVMGPAPDRERRRAVRNLPNVQLEHRPFALEWMPGCWPDVARAGDWLVGLAARFRAELCHLNGYCHAGCDFGAPRLVVAHSCVCSWWEAVHRAGPPDETYRREVAQALRQADAVVAPTRWMLTALQRHYGAVPRGAVIANARSVEGLGPRDKEPFVFGAGRVWDPAKNFLTLDRAASGLPWPVWIAGATQGLKLEHAHALEELSPEVVAGWLGRAAIYALPALYEPFGLSILEAAISGCALVLGDIPSLREQWDGAAAFVDPRDSEGLQAAIAELMAEPSLRSALAGRALEQARRSSPAAQAAAYLSTYDDLTRRASCAS